MKAATPAARAMRDALPRRTVDSSIDAAISRQVRRASPGTVFTPALFVSLGGRAAVDKALQLLVARDELRRRHQAHHDGGAMTRELTTHELPCPAPIAQGLI